MATLSDGMGLGRKDVALRVERPGADGWTGQDRAGTLVCFCALRRQLVIGLEESGPKAHGLSLLPGNKGRGEAGSRTVPKVWCSSGLRGC